MVKIHKLNMVPAKVFQLNLTVSPQTDFDKSFEK